MNRGKSIALLFMNKIGFLVLTLNALFIGQCFGQYKQRARHQYLHTETTIDDIKDPENSRKIIEIIDKKGRLLQYKEFNENGKKIKDLQYQYLKKEKTCYHLDAKDSIKYSEHWQYDRKNRVIEYTHIDRKKNITEKTITHYNKWGEKESEHLYKNDILIKKRTFIYDQQGMLIEQKTENPEGKILYHKQLNFSK